MSRSGAGKVRCAIYTRKSSEEGLDQSFNSLDAQYEACSAYILSQAGEGWTLLKGRYDDGGFSGGNMDRPGLKALLADVDAGLVDVVVVYKVDRLTRSLPDFARIVERLDGAKASFVSVTQAFNTTTSMGRLTLNVLLSFAQFEREVTGERIRDKIAMSKAKGMWLGGACPLGYDPPNDPETRALVVSEAEAETVRLIFRRYLELGSVHLLARDLKAQGVTSKRRTYRSGRTSGGLPLNRGALFYLLKNRTYLGEIVHKQATHPGRQPPIVDRNLFDLVQAKLQEQTPKRRERVVRAATMPLKGIIFDVDGEPMSPTTARGRHPGRMYRYYVSTGLQTGQVAPSEDKLQRVPVDHIHGIIADRVTKLLAVAVTNPAAEPLWADMLPAIERVEVSATIVRIDLRRAVVAPRERGPEQARDLLSRRLPPEDEVWTCPDRPDLLRLVVRTRVRARGGRAWVRDAAELPNPTVRKPDRILIRALREGHRTLAKLSADPESTASRLIHASAPDGSREKERTNLALLAPHIQQAIVEGRSPCGMMVAQLYDYDLPLAWADQIVRLRMAI